MELGRLETSLSVTALSALVLGREDEVQEYLDGDGWHARNTTFSASALGHALAARGVDEENVPWAVLLAIWRHRHQEPIDVDSLARAAHARRARLEAGRPRPPPNPRVIVHADTISILDVIVFDRNAETPAASQSALLDAMTSMLIANPQLRLIELRGRADPKERQPNVLALRRAVSVRDQLASRGIDAARLVPAVFSGASGGPAARGGDRSVDFVIVRRPPVQRRTSE
jgi:outer membrane protein OmpA-like peptidoglycan-associated protein